MYDCLSTFVSGDTIRVVVDKLPDDGASAIATYSLWVAVASLIASVVVACVNTRNLNRRYISMHKMGLLKTVVLEPNIKEVYSIFGCLATKLEQLQVSTCDKVEVEKEIQECFRAYNSILKLFVAIDLELYKSLVQSSDKCLDLLVDKLSDESLCLTDKALFRKEILSPVEEARCAIVRLVYNYKC